MSTILLTGGSGMVGQAIQRANRDAKHEHRLIAPPRHELTLSDGDAVSRFIRERSVEIVIHCAAKVGGIAANIEDPTGFLEENLAINLGVVTGAHSAGITNLLFLGSSCMYPKDFGEVLSEDDLLAAPLEPTNEGYALAKIVGAKHCEYLSRQFGLAFRTIIPCNLYGPGDSFDDHSSHLVAACIKKVWNANQHQVDEVGIWGDGTARREFLYVDDLARFILDKCLDPAYLPQNLNLGFGRDYSVTDYYETARELVGYSGAFRYDLERPVGMKKKLLDSTRAQEIGWNPGTTLRDGMAETLKWYTSDKSALT